MPRRVDLAEFVTSAVGPAGLPRDGRPEIALVGRSNVGKSSLINALVKKDVARTSSTPGKTRQLNVYRVQQQPAAPFYLVDLPGYGYASGGEKAQAEFAEIIGAYFEARGAAPETKGGRQGERGGTESPSPAALHLPSSALRPPPSRMASPLAGCVLVIDARHPGLASDVEALRWLATLAVPTLLVATKADKLSQAERARLKRECEEHFGVRPLVVSALEGDGLDELWKRVREWSHAE